MSWSLGTKNGIKLDMLSGLAGTRMYLSPEQLDPMENNIYVDNKVDIYALGLILLEVASNIGTLHEKIEYFDRLKTKREIPESCSAFNQIEGELILRLTETSPKRRPTAEEIKKVWLNKWERSLDV